MKLPFLLFSFISVSAFGQSLKFSPNAVEPRSKLNSGTSSAGITGNSYIIDESSGGGAFFDGGVRDVLHYFDANTLAKTKEVSLNGQIKSIAADDVYNITNVSLKDRTYVFFLSIADKNVYPIYCQLFDASGKLLKEEKTALQIDNSKVETWNNKRDHAMKTAETFVVKKSFDGSSLLTAVTSKNVDDDNSMINISVWDADMKSSFSADYKITMQKWARTRFEKKQDAKILDIADDKNGYLYALIQSGDPANAKSANLFCVYQFSKKDKQLVKQYKAEFTGNMMQMEVKLITGMEGKVFVTAIGNEEQDNDRNTNKVSSYYVGEFNADGKLTQRLGGQLPIAEWLSIFDGSDDKKQEKKGFIYNLHLNDIKQDKSGGLYLIWEQAVEFVKLGTQVNSYSTNFENVLVQYFTTGKKPMWEKIIYKNQLSKGLGPNSFCSVNVSLEDDNLYLFYPDDPKNAAKPITDKAVEKFSLVKFGNQDLGGLFTLVFNNKGLVRRNYLAWPEDKKGYAFETTSISYASKGEFIGMVRVLSQGVFSFEQKSFTALKIVP